MFAIASRRGYNPGIHVAGVMTHQTRMHRLPFSGRPFRSARAPKAKRRKRAACGVAGAYLTRHSPSGTYITIYTRDRLLENGYMGHVAMQFEIACEKLLRSKLSAHERCTLECHAHGPAGGPFISSWDCFVILLSPRMSVRSGVRPTLCSALSRAQAAGDASGRGSRRSDTAIQKSDPTTLDRSAQVCARVCSGSLQ